MKTLSRIFTICLCSAPLYCAFADGPVATTAGSNLTAYHASNANNNQWATMSNGRDSSAPSAKVDFGNCNAIVLRCAQPKCGNGGCTDMNVAAGIVAGCVQSNETCKKYGNDLISAMSAQLVASSTAKNNSMQLQMAQQQQAAQQQQMAEMQSQMQQQMMQMQQQMAEQNAQTQAQLENAIAQQQAQNAATLANITAAAENAAKEKESGLSAYQEDAVSRGISADILEREKISGQILTEIENAEVALDEAKQAMQDAFEYAGCDARGNGCEGPKRIKKFRERASNFMDPYDKVVDKIYEALDTAVITGGIDLSDVYMMLTNGCQRWMQYMCEKGSVEYLTDENGKKMAPMSCPDSTEIERIKEICKKDADKDITRKENESETDFMKRKLNFEVTCENMRKQQTCRPCTPLKPLTEESQIYEGWVNADYNDTSSNTTVVACGDNGILSNSMLGRRAKTKNGTGTRTIDEISTWLSQTEPSSKNANDNMGGIIEQYCSVTDDSILRKAVVSKTIPTGSVLCIDNLGKKQTKESAECPFINPIYALCDTHAYNAGKNENPSDSAERAKIKEIVGLKTTVIAQQMYKQYEYLAATLRRLKTQLKKATLTAKLEAAGAKSDNSSSSTGGLAGGSSSADKQNGIYLAGAQNCSIVYDPALAYSCLHQNATIIANEYKDKNAKKQLRETLNSAFFVFDDTTKATLSNGQCTKCIQDNKIKTSCDGNMSKDEVKSCATAIIWAVNSDKEIRENKKSGANVLKGLLGG